MHEKYSQGIGKDSWKELCAELKGETFFNKFLIQLAETVYMNFGLLLVTFILLINVFSTNLLSLGYLVFALVLIFLNITFFKDIDS